MTTVACHTWAFCYLWAACGHLAVESIGISVWWSDFSILQAFCKETQPDNLVAKYIWNNFTRHLQILKVKKKKKKTVMVIPKNV